MRTQTRPNTFQLITVKEIAVVGLQLYWIISTPCGFSKISKIAKIHCTYNKTYEYHLCWIDGQSSIEKENHCVREITRSADFCVDGSHAERKFIENIIGRNVINLDKTKIPSFNRLRMNYEESIVSRFSPEFCMM